MSRFGSLYQMIETLVGLAPGTTKIVPELATSWKKSADGRTWTFNLAAEVRFHDGTPFNAQAVCANFNRWYNFKGALQNPARRTTTASSSAASASGQARLPGRTPSTELPRVNQYAAAVNLRSRTARSSAR